MSLTGSLQGVEARPEHCKSSSNSTQVGFLSWVYRTAGVLAAFCGALWDLHACAWPGSSQTPLEHRPQHTVLQLRLAADK